MATSRPERRQCKPLPGAGIGITWSAATTRTRNIALPNCTIRRRSKSSRMEPDSDSLFAGSALKLFRVRFKDRRHAF
jgi:hypothetical protein